MGEYGFFINTETEFAKYVTSIFYNNINHNIKVYIIISEFNIQKRYEMMLEEMILT